MLVHLAQRVRDLHSLSLSLAVFAGFGFGGVWWVDDHMVGWGQQQQSHGRSAGLALLRSTILLSAKVNNIFNRLLKSKSRGISSSP